MTRTAGIVFGVIVAAAMAFTPANAVIRIHAAATPKDVQAPAAANNTGPPPDVFVVAQICGAALVVVVPIVLVIWFLVRSKKAQQSPAYRTCPVCGQALAWIPQYYRWYCPACAQYR